MNISPTNPLSLYWPLIKWGVIIASTIATIVMWRADQETIATCAEERTALANAQTEIKTELQKAIKARDDAVTENNEFRKNYRAAAGKFIAGANAATGLQQTATDNIVQIKTIQKESKGETECNRMLQLLGVGGSVRGK